MAQLLNNVASSNKVHILGVGSIGRLIGYELSTIQNKPDIVLLFRNSAKEHKFKTVNGSSITVERIFKEPIETLSSQFGASSPGNLTEAIENLIISTKTYQTRDALRPYIPFINKNTNIILVQNGFGVLEELYEHTWPDVTQRPNFYQGVINHGAFIPKEQSDKFEVRHSGLSNFFVGKVPNSLNAEPTLEEKPMIIKQLEDAEILDTKFISYEDLLLIQIRKFMVNACINPNTSIIDCINGDLGLIEESENLFRDIIKESLHIFKTVIPTLKNIPNVDEFLNEDDLLKTVMDVGTVVNKKNSSSMRQDVINLRDTEIDYINGYVVGLAEKNGLRADVNKTISRLLKIKLGILRHSKTS